MFEITIHPEKADSNANTFESLPDFGDIFAPYLTKKAPEILKILSEKVVDGVKQTEVQYASKDRQNTIYAKIYMPEKEGVYPGLVVYHGGGGYAATNAPFAQFMAQNGYAVITPDLPGIAGVDKIPYTDGPFEAKGMNQAAQIGMDTDPRNSTIFDGVLSAIDAFYLLASQENVDAEHMGITGGSWGGYTTTKIAGLLGEDVTCAYSTYGCAYYDAGTHWSKNVFPNFGEVNEKLWMHYLDASVHIQNISCPYFIESPTNDSYFFPSAVKKTLENISSYTNKAFTANMNHTMYKSANEQRLAYFDYYLKGKGNGILKLQDIQAVVRGNEGVDVSFKLGDNRTLKAQNVYYADADLDWTEKRWGKAEAVIENGVAKVFIPSHLLFKNTILYGFALDSAACYSSTDILVVENAPVRELTEEEKIALAESDILINTNDEAFSGVGTWTDSSIVGYEFKSKYSFNQDAEASFKPTLQDGVYNVSVYVIVYSTNQPFLHVVIHTKNGDVEQDVSTDIPESAWVNLGDFEFAAGNNGGVTISAYDKTLDEAKKQLQNPIRVDSVRFKKTGDLAEDNEIQVLLNGEKLSFPADQKPVLVNDRTMVAFRGIFEALGLSVGWDDATQTASGSKAGLDISLSINNPAAYVNGQEKVLDVPAQLIADRTYVPLRFLSEAVGYQVDWMEETQTVVITEK